MANHHVVGDASPFLKRVLIPFWVVRIVVMGIYILMYGLIIVALAGFRNDIERELRNEYNTNLAYSTVMGVSVTMLLIAVFCLVMDLVCIIKRARRSLSPRFFLIVNVIQTTIWTVLFVLQMIGARRAANIAVSVVIYLSFFGMLVYAAITFHQHRKGTLRNAGYKAPTQQNDIHGFNPNANYGAPNAQAYGAAPYAPQDYYGAAKPDQQYGQHPQQQQPYGQPPQYGYAAESHEMQNRQ